MRAHHNYWSLSGCLTTSSSEDVGLVGCYVSNSPCFYHTFRFPQLGCGRQLYMNTRTFDLTEFLLRSFGLHTLANYPRYHSHSSWNPFFMSLGSHYTRRFVPLKDTVLDDGARSIKQPQVHAAYAPRLFLVAFTRRLQRDVCLELDAWAFRHRWMHAFQKKSQ